MSLDSHLLFDSSALDEVRELEADGETNLVDDLINNYKLESLTLMQAVKTALIEGNRLDAERSAHSLKSSSQLIGAIRLSVIMAELEDFARENKLKEVSLRVALAEHILQETLPMISR